MSVIAAVVTGVVGAGLSYGASTLLSGGKPRVPNYPNIDPETLQRQQIAANLRNLPAAEALASKVNAGNRKEKARAIESMVPGAIGQIQKNISDDLAGVSDVEDTKAAIRNATAANFSLGVGGASQFSKFAVVGKLGRSVAQQKQQGANTFGFFSKLMEAPTMDPTSMFFSVSDRVKLAQNEAAQSFDVALARAAIDAQPSATEKAIGAGLGALGSVATMGAGYILMKGLSGPSGGMAPSGGYSSGWGPTSLTGSMGTTAPAAGGFNFPGKATSAGMMPKKWYW